MRNRNKRLTIIVDLIRKNHIGSQDILKELLKENGYTVTQATLSRDLKSLRISKTSDSEGKPVYMVPDIPGVKDSYRTSDTPTASSGFVSLTVTGPIAVIKTRTGYAPGMAYDIDVSYIPELLGTISGTDTIFVALREGLTRREILEIFNRLYPAMKFDNSIFSGS